MRFPNLSHAVTLANGALYTVEHLLKEFVLGAGLWSQDEATIAAFDRIVAALKTVPIAMEDGDFDRIVNALRSINFPPHVAIELSHLRNKFVLSPKEAPKE